MVGKCLFVGIVVLICSCLGAAGQPARPLFVKFAGCSRPSFFPQVSTQTYRQHLVKTLMQVFRLRHPNEAVGGPQVMAACAQAAALLDAYRSVHSAYLDYHMQHDAQSGMSEDSAAWMAGSFNLILQEDQAAASDENIRKGLKWCIDSTLVVQKILSQRALTEANESPTSPGNAFNNLLEASRAAGASHTRRVAQYLLSRCHDEEGSETDRSLLKAVLSLSWGSMTIEEVLEPHTLLVQAVRSVVKSKLLTDSDKKRVQKNCSRIGMPQMKPFSPSDKDPQTFDEVVVSLYSVPSSEGNEPGHGEDGGGETHDEHSGSNGHPEPRIGSLDEAAGPSGEQPFPRGPPPPTPPAVHRGNPPLQAKEEERPHQSVVIIPSDKNEEANNPQETEEAQATTQEEGAQSEGVAVEPTGPPPQDKEQPSAEGNHVETVEDKHPSGISPIVVVAPPSLKEHESPKPTPSPAKQGQDGPHEGSSSGKPLMPPTNPHEESSEQKEKSPKAHPHPLPTPHEHPEENVEREPKPGKILPDRIKVSSASSRFPERTSGGASPNVKRSPSDNYIPRKEVKPRPRSADLYSHRLLANVGSDAATQGKPPGPSGSINHKGSGQNS